MNIHDFEMLLSRSESDTLDFKATPYDLSQEYARAAFVKDVVCMANTPRSEPALLVLGVKNLPNGRKELLGLSKHLDDADLQQQFSALVYPIPSFSYEIITYQDKDFGIISIPPKRIGPCVPVKDHKNVLRQYQVYFRRNSMNDVAQPADLHEIVGWIAHGPRQAQPVANVAQGWVDFIDSVEDFTGARNFVLLTNGLGDGAESLAAHLGKPSWLAVIDFARVGVGGAGSLDYVRAEVARNRALHIVLPGKLPAINPGTSTYWYAARGDQLTDPSLVTQSFPDWMRSLKPRLGEFLRRLASDAPAKPTTFLCVWYGGLDPLFLRSAVEAALESFGQNARMVLVCDGLAEIQAVASEYGLDAIAIPKFQLLSGLGARWNQTHPDRQTQVAIRSSSGAPIPITNKDLAWLEEELEIVHDTVGSVRLYADDVDRPFLRGSQISWYEIGLHVDVERDATGRVESAVRTDIHDKRSTRINLYHAPGAGATTVAKRTLWNFRRQLPCAILRRTTPLETIERLSFLHSVSAHRILLLADGSDVAERDLDDLYELIRARHLPVILLQVLRRFRKQNEAKRSLYLSQHLSAVEVQRFAEIFEYASPSRRAQIQTLAKATDSSLLNPFYFGLVAFESEFRGLESYVHNGISDLTSVQREALLSVALAHRYSQRSMPARAFAELFGVPKSRTVLMPAFFPEHTLSLLIEETPGLWRTTHHLIATEIIEQLLSHGSDDRRTWRQGLADAARRFATLCRGTDSVANEDLQDLLRRAFIYRDNVEVLGKETAGVARFSQLIEEMPLAETALEVLRHLTELFPTDPHFWAHLGRFHSIKQNNYEQALRCLDIAIQLSPDDHVLIHMKGMATRSHLYQAIDQRNEVSTLVPIARLASEAFQRAQALDSDAEYGFISEAQMLIRLIEYAAAAYKMTPVGLASSTKVDPILREAFDRVEALLASVRRLREGDDDSKYERSCRATLDGLYGNYELALQTWDGLLSRDDVYLPPIRRQLIWAYLARRNRSWDGLKGKEIEKAIQLLESNLEEEPFDERNLRLWIQAVRRRTTPPTIESVVERVARWRANTTALDATYYLYVLYALMTLEGSAASLVSTERYLEETRQRAGYRRDRTKSFEWLGKGERIQRLVHHSSLGDWRPDTDFWEKSDLLSRETARISRIAGPQSGELTLVSGLRAFFVPGVSGQAKGRDENQVVTCFIGFSYEGLRAWEVRARD